MHVAFVVPGDVATVSGGYAYDRAVIGALRDAGHTVEVVAPDAFDAIDAAARIVVDGLSLPAFEHRQDALAARGAVGLIHHPTALETGLDEPARERLRAIETALFARLRGIIVTSDSTADRLATEFGVARETITTVIPGTDDAPRATGSGGPHCAILSVGTLVPRKGHDVLLRALARLFDLDWRLTIVGGTDRDQVHAHTLAALADELQVTRKVTFAGEVGDAALADLWRTTDIFALATHFEGYGMAVAEALKRGIPVAVTNGGAAGALVTPESGAVCTVGERDMISKALRRMIVDLPLRRDMAEGAWRIGQTLPDWPTQGRAFAAALAT